MDTLAALERELCSVQPPVCHVRQAVQAVNRALSRLQDRYRELTAGLREADVDGASDVLASDVAVVPDDAADHPLTPPEALQGGYDAIA